MRNAQLPTRAASYTQHEVDMIGYKVPVATIADDLTFLLGRVVLDNSGITGEVDVHLDWTPDPTMPLDPAAQRPPDDKDRPTLFSALQEQLGLRLEARRAPIPVLVIQHVEKPAEN